MKGCLKQVSTPLPSHQTKSVSFREQHCFEIHEADDWDRTPVEMAHKLSYHDILELKEMQIAMARAHPKAHAFNYPNILVNIPMRIVPLLPDSPAPSPSQTPSTTPPASPRSALASLPFTFPVKTVPALHHPPSPPTTPPRAAFAPIPAPLPPKARNFAFLPLLEAPPESDTPEPSPDDIIAALPSAIPLSPPDEPPHPSKSSYFPTQSTDSHPPVSPDIPPSFTAYNPVARKVRLQPLPSPVLIPPSPFSLYPPSPPLERQPGLLLFEQQQMLPHGAAEIALDDTQLAARRTAQHPSSACHSHAVLESESRGAACQTLS